MIATEAWGDWIAADARLSAAIDSLRDAWILSRKRVLVVDDDPDCATDMCQALRPIPTRRAGTADQAAEELRRYVPHVLVTDLQFHNGEDGRDLARRAISMPSPPIVVLVSGIDRDLLDHLGRSLGAIAWFQKPFDPDRLRAAVERALLGR